MLSRLWDVSVRDTWIGARMQADRSMRMLDRLES